MTWLVNLRLPVRPSHCDPCRRIAGVIRTADSPDPRIEAAEGDRRQHSELAHFAELWSDA